MSASVMVDILYSCLQMEITWQRTSKASPEVRSPTLKCASLQAFGRTWILLSGITLVKLKRKNKSSFVCVYLVFFCKELWTNGMCSSTISTENRFQKPCLVLAFRSRTTSSSSSGWFKNLTNSYWTFLTRLFLALKELLMWRSTRVIRVKWR